MYNSSSSGNDQNSNNANNNLKYKSSLEGTKGEEIVATSSAGQPKSNTGSSSSGSSKRDISSHSNAAAVAKAGNNAMISSNDKRNNNDDNKSSFGASDLFCYEGDEEKQTKKIARNDDIASLGNTSSKHYNNVNSNENNNMKHTLGLNEFLSRLEILTCTPTSSSVSARSSNSSVDKGRAKYLLEACAGNVDLALNLYVESTMMAEDESTGGVSGAAGKASNNNYSYGIPSNATSNNGSSNYSIDSAICDNRNTSNNTHQYSKKKNKQFSQDHGSIIRSVIAAGNVGHGKDKNMTSNDNCSTNNKKKCCNDKHEQKKSEQKKLSPPEFSSSSSSSSCSSSENRSIDPFSWKSKQWKSKHQPWSTKKMPCSKHKNPMPKRSRRPDARDETTGTSSDITAKENTTVASLLERDKSHNDTYGALRASERRLGMFDASDSSSSASTSKLKANGSKRNTIDPKRSDYSVNGAVDAAVASAADSEYQRQSINGSSSSQVDTKRGVRPSFSKASSLKQNNTSSNRHTNSTHKNQDSLLASKEAHLLQQHLDVANQHQVDLHLIHALLGHGSGKDVPTASSFSRDVATKSGKENGKRLSSSMSATNAATEGPSLSLSSLAAATSKSDTAGGSKPSGSRKRSSSGNNDFKKKKNSRSDYSFSMAERRRQALAQAAAELAELAARGGDSSLSGNSSSNNKNRRGALDNFDEAAIQPPPLLRNANNDSGDNDNDDDDNIIRNNNQGNENYHELEQNIVAAAAPPQQQQLGGMINNNRDDQPNRRHQNAAAAAGLIQVDDDDDELNGNNEEQESNNINNRRNNHRVRARVARARVRRGNNSVSVSDDECASSERREARRLALRQAGVSSNSSSDSRRGGNAGGGSNNNAVGRGVAAAGAGGAGGSISNNSGGAQAVEHAADGSSSLNANNPANNAAGAAGAAAVNHNHRIDNDDETNDVSMAAHIEEDGSSVDNDEHDNATKKKRSRQNDMDDDDEHSDDDDSLDSECEEELLHGSSPLAILWNTPSLQDSMDADDNDDNDNDSDDMPQGGGNGNDNHRGINNNNPSNNNVVAPGAAIPEHGRGRQSNSSSASSTNNSTPVIIPELWRNCGFALSSCGEGLVSPLNSNRSIPLAQQNQNNNAGSSNSLRLSIVHHCGGIKALLSIVLALIQSNASIQGKKVGVKQVRERFADLKTCVEKRKQYESRLADAISCLLLVAATAANKRNAGRENAAAAGNGSASESSQLTAFMSRSGRQAALAANVVGKTLDGAGKHHYYPRTNQTSKQGRPPLCRVCRWEDLEEPESWRNRMSEALRNNNSNPIGTKVGEAISVSHTHVQDLKRHVISSLPAFMGPGGCALLLETIIRIHGLKSVKRMVRSCATAASCDSIKNSSMRMRPLIHCDCDAKGKLVASKALAHRSNRRGGIGGPNNISCSATQKARICEVGKGAGCMSVELISLILTGSVHSSFEGWDTGGLGFGLLNGGFLSESALDPGAARADAAANNDTNNIGNSNLNKAAKNGSCNSPTNNSSSISFPTSSNWKNSSHAIGKGLLNPIQPVWIVRGPRGFSTVWLEKDSDRQYMDTMPGFSFRMKHWNCSNNGKATTMRIITARGTNGGHGKTGKRRNWFSGGATKPKSTMGSYTKKEKQKELVDAATTAVIQEQLLTKIKQETKIATSSVVTHVKKRKLCLVQKEITNTSNNDNHQQRINNKITRSSTTNADVVAAISDNGSTIIKYHLDDCRNYGGQYKLWRFMLTSSSSQVNNDNANINTKKEPVDHNLKRSRIDASSLLTHATTAITTVHISKSVVAKSGIASRLENVNSNKSAKEQQWIPYYRLSKSQKSLVDIQHGPAIHSVIWSRWPGSTVDEFSNKNGVPPLV
eukprot:CAMPEP_0194415816 /NCGR_PEP_ID=MMETSP0176-20130528/14638_1 /TAXON_ID=216777 /ORGANISM="Proboscia alata, Strain PI-D3" /LENGTH=1867 /DNA_ID=CAMNT_0039220699 /DNA_START=292 /DNA_END=5895 /DNA_ORIENTATION=-